MGNNCCVRDKGLMETQNTSSMNHQQPHSRFSLQQFQVLEKLSHFNPRKNALPAALTHYLQDGCQGLLRSIPRLIEISEIYAPKGDQSHYFDPLILQEKFCLTECVSPGKQFYLDNLSGAFQSELNYFYQNNIIKETAQSWGVILIMKIGKQTHSFTIKKRNGWEYVLHTLYEVTDEELKEEQEQIRRQQLMKKEKQKNRLQRLQTQQMYDEETEQNIEKLQCLLYSEESTQQDEIIQNPDDIKKNNSSTNQSSNIDSSSTTNQNSQKDPSQDVQNQQHGYQIKINDEPQLQQKNSQENMQNRRSIINPVKRYSELPRQSTRATFRQINDLRLRDMVFKGYNCGEICFSPYEVFLEYLNSITEEYQLPSNQNPEVKVEKMKGYLQLITFKREFTLDFSNKDAEHDYTDLLSPEK